MKKQIILLLVLAYLVCSSTSGQITNNKPLFLIKQNGKSGYIDVTGKVIIEPKFDWAQDFSEGLAAAALGTDKQGYIDRTGTMVIALKYVGAQGFKEGLAAVAFDPTGHGGQTCLHCDPDYDWGFIDRQGKQVILPIYHDAYGFSEGLAAVENKSYKWGFVDKTGKELIPPQYDRVGGYSDGLAVVRKGDKTGYIDHSGKIVIPMIYTAGEPFSNGVAAVRIGGQVIPLSSYVPIIGDIYAGSNFLLIDHVGKPVFKFEGGRPEWFSEGLSSYVLPNNKCGYVDQRGKLVIAAEYYECKPFSDGVAMVTLPSNTSVNRCIDNTGKTVFETTVLIYRYAGFKDEIARLSNGGYIDKTGRIVWEPSK